jgi:hypothetical protein
VGLMRQAYLREHSDRVTGQHIRTCNPACCRWSLSVLDESRSHSLLAVLVLV